MTAPRAGIYTRISRSPADDGGGSARQENECRRLARDLGVDVVRVYAEGDASAFAARRRPEFDRMLADVAAGFIDVVIAWHPDRIYRRQRDLVPFVDTVQAANASVATVLAGELNLGSPSGRMVARVVGALAEHESERKAERLRLKHEELARDGRWPGGCRPYGYHYVGDGMLEVVPAEARVIHEAADRVLAGESVSAVCRDLTKRGVPTARGGLWYTGTLLDVLTKPSVYGYRTHRSGVCPGVWEPILDRATVERLNRVARKPPSKAQGLPALLTGLVRCGRCGTRLQNMGPATNAYRCIKPPEGRGCGSLAVTATRADEAVMAAVVDALSIDRHGRRQSETELDAGTEEPSTRDEAAVGDFLSLYESGTITRQEWDTARRTLTVASRTAQPNLGLNGGPLPLGPLVLNDLPQRRADLAAAWNASTVDQRRSLLRAALTQIVVQPARRRGGPFDPSRVVDGIAWRESS